MIQKALEAARFRPTCFGPWLPDCNLFRRVSWRLAQFPEASEKGTVSNFYFHFLERPENHHMMLDNPNASRSVSLLET
jgi:hypothetical protein